jgi:SAM-dependent methyltransferase
MDIVEYNREAWTREVAGGNKWTVPVDGATVARARRGDWGILLTPTKAVPRSWFGDLEGARVLCLASGGGQQGPILAAAGASVTVFDNCPAQLEQDRLVADREGLALELVQGDMKDLSAFPDACFDLVFHPVSNLFVEEVETVWRECARVLRRGGRLLAGFCNPLSYIFDLKAWDETKELRVRYKIPYSDVEQLPPEQLAERMRTSGTLEFGHSLESQIGGQLEAGLSLIGFFEDISNWGFLDPNIKTFIATCALK